MPKEKDPLTEEIFGALENQESILVRRSEEDALTRAIFANLGFEEKTEEAATHSVLSNREFLLKEIEGINPIDLVDLERIIILRPLARNKEIKPELAATQESLNQDLVRAEENWFSAELADLSPQTKSFKIDYKDEASSWKKKIVLAGLAIIIFAGGLGMVRDGNFFSLAKDMGAKLFSAENKEFLSSQSFVLLNAEEDLSFPPLFLLKKNIEEKEKELIAQAANNKSSKNILLESAQELREMEEILNNFFEINENFSWVNMFRQKVNNIYGGEVASYPLKLGLVSQVLQKKISLEKKSGITIEPSNKDINSYGNWLNFWTNILTQDASYLILSTHPENRSPAGGEPYNYIVLNIQGGKLSIGESGKVTDLNAAMTHKIIPPEPIQVMKTNFDFLEAGWFLETEKFAVITRDFYESTTGQSIDGVILVSHELLVELNQKQGFNFNPNEPDWFSEIITTLLRRPQVNWRVFEQSLNQAIKDKRIIAWFNDEELERFVKDNNLEISLDRKTFSNNNQGKQDSFSLGLRSWGGSDFGIETIEYEPKFFVDGSIVSKLSLFLRNNKEEDADVYLKFYLPLSSTILANDGFSEKPNSPNFDYISNGFSQNQNILKLSSYYNEIGLENFDFFQEGEFLVLGAWVLIPSSARKVVSLEYRLPFRLDWQSGRDSYELAILKPGFSGSIPFRFRTSLEDNIGFNWQEPKGFISDSSAEYQIILRGDELLKAEIIYKNE